MTELERLLISNCISHDAHEVYIFLEKKNLLIHVHLNCLNCLIRTLTRPKAFLIQNNGWIILLFQHGYNKFGQTVFPFTNLLHFYDIFYISYYITVNFKSLNLGHFPYYSTLLF